MSYYSYAANLKREEPHIGRVTIVNRLVLGWTEAASENEARGVAYEQITTGNTDMQMLDLLVLELPLEPPPPRWRPIEEGGMGSRAAAARYGCLTGITPG